MSVTCHHAKRHHIANMHCKYGMLNDTAMFNEYLMHIIISKMEEECNKELIR
jgi:hypothetical protein